MPARRRGRDKPGLIAGDFHAVFQRSSDKELNGPGVQMALWLAVQELKEENDELKQLVCEDHSDSPVCAGV